jgi:hypothetical protein
MSETINTQEAPEFSPRFLRWLFSLTIVVLITVFFIEPKITGSEQSGENLLVPPFLLAAGEIIKYGINEFQGLPIAPLSTDVKLHALVMLLFGLIFGPTLVFFLGRSPENEDEQTTVQNTVRTLLFLLVLFSTGLVVLSTAIGAIRSPIIYQTMQKDNEIGEQRDMLINELVALYPRIIEYYYLPEKMGGGNRSFMKKNPDGTQSMITSLEEFGINPKTPYGTLALAPITSNSQLVIYGIGTTPMKDNTYLNSDGSTGKIQYAIQIVPPAPEYTIQKFN